jgi:hypothetical protein
MAVVLMSFPSAVFADRIDAALKDVVDRLAAADSPADPREKPVVSVGNLTYADKKIGSAFSRYLMEKLGVALVASGRFDYFNREKLDQVLSAAELSMSDIFDQSTAVPLSLKGIQAILSGTFFDAGTDVKVFLELQDVGSGASRGKVEATLSKADVPTGISILPGNYADAVSVLEELGAIQNADAKDFKVKVWTDRGDGGTYLDGERMVVNFFASRDCYIRIFHIDVNRQMKPIFPNQYFRDNSIKSKKLYRIPDSSYPFTFDLGEPFGTEFIKVIASTVAFTDKVEAFDDLGSAAKGLVTRGLNVAAKDKQVTEAIVSYTIVK